MFVTFYNGHEELYHPAKFGRTTRTGCRCENVVFVCLFCHALRPECCSFEGVYFEQVLCCRLWVDFDAVFSIFSEGIALSDGLDILIFLLLDGATIFAKL